MITYILEIAKFLFLYSACYNILIGSIMFSWRIFKMKINKLIALATAVSMLFTMGGGIT